MSRRTTNQRSDRYMYPGGMGACYSTVWQLPRHSSDERQCPQQRPFNLETTKQGTSIVNQAAGGSQSAANRRQDSYRDSSRQCHCVHGMLGCLMHTKVGTSHMLIVTEVIILNENTHPAIASENLKRLGRDTALHECTGGHHDGMCAMQQCSGCVTCTLTLPANEGRSKLQISTPG